MTDKKEKKSYIDYAYTNAVHISLKFHKKNDADILAAIHDLMAADGIGKQTAIKKIIRLYIEFPARIRAYIASTAESSNKSDKAD